MILGIDEVGRGPWAGPLVVGAAVLGNEFMELSTGEYPKITKLPENASQEQEILYLWQHLTDSKKLTAKSRDQLNELILKHAAAYGLGWVSARELDSYGLSRSLKLATRRATKQILATKIKFDKIIIDGTVNFLRDTPLENYVATLKKADLTIKEVSAASIIAKVARDKYMVECGEKYPGYGFEKHVGYGTAIHSQALVRQGVCPEHRQSFRPIKEIVEQFSSKCPDYGLKNDSSDFLTKAPSSSQKGQTAENEVASYLKSQNHEIIAQNFKTKSYEIDLISIQKAPKNSEKPKIFFTEVKYSQNDHAEGTPLVRITEKKIAKMHFAAKCFLESHSKYQNFNPILAAASVSGPNYQVRDWFILA